MIVTPRRRSVGRHSQAPFPGEDAPGTGNLFAKCKISCLLQAPQLMQPCPNLFTYLSTQNCAAWSAVTSICFMHGVVMACGTMILYITQFELYNG